MDMARSVKSFDAVLATAHSRRGATCNSRWKSKSKAPVGRAWVRRHAENLA